MPDVRKFQQLWPTLKRLLAYGSPYRRTLLLAVLMLWIAATAEVCGPALVSYFIDHVLTTGSFPVKVIVTLVVVYLLLQILAAVLQYFQALLFNQAAVNVVQRLRSDVMEAALRQPLSAFDMHPVGQLISRVTNDTEVIRDLYVTVVSTVLRSAALISAMLIAMFSLEWRLALIAILIFPAVFAVMLIYQHYSTGIIRNVRSLLADINNGFNEYINGIGIIQQFRQQLHFGKKLHDTSVGHYQARMQALRLEGFLLRPLLSLFSAMVLCGLLLLFGFSPSGTIGVGVLYAFINYLGRLNEPLIELTSQQAMLQQAIVAGERIFELIDAPKQQYGQDDTPLTRGDIRIKNLTFAYRPGEPVIHNVSLNVQSGGFIAFVGHTGSGKSTLASLLMGYYPVADGSIFLDGRELKTLTHQTLRNGIAMVQQDPVVIAESVFHNVALGRETTEEQIWQVLEIVHLADLVKGFPEGLQTHLGEQGNNLSVGQKQLLALARVLIAPPQILILDEATANIDSGTEQAIQQALNIVRQKSTLVVIAHRLSTIVEADEIFVLHQGSIVEQGTHRQLLGEKGRYSQMYQLQQAATRLILDETTEANRSAVSENQPLMY